MSVAILTLKSELHARGWSINLLGLNSAERSNLLSYLEPDVMKEIPEAGQIVLKVTKNERKSLGVSTLYPPLEEITRLLKTLVGQGFTLVGTQSAVVLNEHSTYIWTLQNVGSSE